MILGLHWLVAVVGAGGILYGSRLVRRGRETVRSLARRYAVLTSHSDQLGMQALIGRDLRALVSGWIPRRTFQTASVRVGFFFIICFSMLWVAVLAHVGPFEGTFVGHACQALLQSLDGGEVNICSTFGVGSNKWFQWVILFAWFILAVGCFVALLGDYGVADRVLLIVDDLDRCGPQEIVDLIESLKLLLEDEEVQDRVQVLMLVDEDVLAHAIAVSMV
jgi:KAP family P-loop domain